MSGLSSSRAARTIAALAVLFVLGAQGLGALHSHRFLLISGLSANTAPHATAGECPVCLFTCHAQAAASAVSLTPSPHLRSEGLICKVSPAFLTFLLSSPHGRAPPLSA